MNIKGGESESIKVNACACITERDRVPPGHEAQRKLHRTAW
jgi:hypothetical protein